MRLLEERRDLRRSYVSRRLTVCSKVNSCDRCDVRQLFVTRLVIGPTPRVSADVAGISLGLVDGVHECPFVSLRSFFFSTGQCYVFLLVQPGWTRDVLDCSDECCVSVIRRYDLQSISHVIRLTGGCFTLPRILYIAAECAQASQSDIALPTCQSVMSCTYTYYIMRYINISVYHVTQGFKKHFTKD